MWWMRAIFGPAYYEPRTAWGPVQALLVAVVGYVAMLGAARYAVIEIMIATSPARWPGEGRGDRLLSVFLRGTFLFWAHLLMGVLLLGTAWLLARRGGMRASDVLALRLPVCGPRVLVLIAVVAAIGLAAYFVVQLARYAGLPHSSIPVELRGWVLMTQNAGWPLAVLSMVIVGPVAHEVWFRGFLLPALARTRLGFWGAAVLTNALFAASYLATSPLTAVVSIFLGGVLLAWTLGLTGSLWVPIAIHMSYSLLALLWLRVLGPLWSLRSGLV